MIDPITVAIILQVVNMGLTAVIVPVVGAVIEFMRRVEKSSCCGSNIELTHINELKEELKATKSEHQIQIDNLTKIVEKQDIQN
jgi:hypothetical protein